MTVYSLLNMVKYVLSGSEREWKKKKKEWCKGWGGPVATAMVMGGRYSSPLQQYTKFIFKNVSVPIFTRSKKLPENLMIEKTAFI